MNNIYNNAYAKARLIVKNKLIEAKNLNEEDSQLVESLLASKSDLIAEVAAKLVEKAAEDTNDKFGKKFDAETVKGRKAKNIIQYSKFDEERLSESAVFKALESKSEASGINLVVLGEVYDRGWGCWNEDMNVTRQQYAFARVNSFINQGKTYFTEDADLAEGLGQIDELSKPTLKRYLKAATTDLKATEKEKAKLDKKKFDASIAHSQMRHADDRAFRATTQKGWEKANKEYGKAKKSAENTFTKDDRAKRDVLSDRVGRRRDGIGYATHKMNNGLHEDSRSPQEKVDAAIKYHKSNLANASSHADRQQEIEDHKSFLKSMKEKHPEVRIDESKNKPYVKPHFGDVNYPDKQTAWKSSNKHGKVRYWQMFAKKSALAHAGLTEEMFQEAFDAEKFSKRYDEVMDKFGGKYLHTTKGHKGEHGSGYVTGPDLKKDNHVILSVPVAAGVRSKNDNPTKDISVHTKHLTSDWKQRHLEESLNEGKMKDVMHDLENLDHGNFVKKYGKTKGKIKDELKWIKDPNIKEENNPDDRLIGTDSLTKVYKDETPGQEVDESVTSAEKVPVVVPSHKDAYGNTIPAKTVMKKTQRHIVSTGNVHDGK